MSAARRSLIGVLVGTAVAVVATAGYAAKRVLVDNVRRDIDPHEGEDFTLPPDTRHRHLPTYDGGVLHVVERGDPTAQPLVLLHGITLQAGIWHYQFLDLAERFRVIAPDIRGHGQSIAGSDGYGLDRVANDLAGLLIELDLRDAIVVGHSMGGMAVMRFCADHAPVLDERVAGLVFVATTPGFALPGSVHGVLRKMASGATHCGDTIGWKLPWYGFPKSDLSFAVVRSVFGADPSPAHIELTRRMVADVPTECFLPSGFGLVGHHARDELVSTKTPSLVVVGSRDRMTPTRDARRIASTLPHARLVELSGCGHQVMLERREELADMLRDFGDEVRSDRAR